MSFTLKLHCFMRVLIFKVVASSKDQKQESVSLV